MATVVNAGDFRAVMGAYATGVAVATAALPDGRRAGVTINSFTSVSLDPALVLFCLEYRSAAYEVFSAAPGYAINILDAGQEQVSRAFARRGQDDERWQGLALEVWESGAPVFSDCLARIDCRIHACHEGGDHAILVGQVLRLERRSASAPLLYWNSGYGRLASG